ncbi:MAG: DUF3047 domain-containing protein [Casimicrobiaceae bacterium]
MADPRTFRPTPFVALALAAAVAVMSPIAHPQATPDAAPLVTPFSTQKAGSEMPAGWEVVKITDQKKPTQYKLVDDGGTVVLSAISEAAATGLGQPTKIDVKTAPNLEWRWKISRLVAAADNAVSSKEDSPARIVLSFGGDRAKLPLTDRLALSLADQRSGKTTPYGTLMYVWSNKAPVGTVIPNPHTGRVQMIVASSGPAGVGAWQSLKRNVFEDYRKAFNEEPGLLMSVGVLTDTDNTGESVEAWYGDIRLLPAAR